MMVMVMMMMMSVDFNFAYTAFLLRFICGLLGVVCFPKQIILFLFGCTFLFPVCSTFLKIPICGIYSKNINLFIWGNGFLFSYCVDYINQKLISAAVVVGSCFSI